MNKIPALLIAFLVSCYAMAQTDLSELEMVKGKWYVIKSKAVFSGDFVEYYPTGEKSGSGTMVDGKVNGLRVNYYKNGNKKTEKEVTNGVQNGFYKEYYEDAKLKIDGMVDAGVKTGVWKMFHPNGKPQIVMEYAQDKNIGVYFEYNIGGNLVSAFDYGKGETEYTEKFATLTDEADQLIRQNKHKEALVVLEKAAKIYPKNAVLNMNIGWCKQNMFQFKESIKDLTKAIELNPELKEAYAFRASATVNLHNKAIRANTATAEKKSACDDLNKAVSLGDVSVFTEDLIFIYCKEK
ncbi:MAG: hypothetical protein HYZ43_02745 [Flavobacteriia bacterium]|nr:hypothetical protein [Flavobacteriia bacterium]